MHDYNGKAVVITGAASGLGKGMAQRFAAQGARLSLADIDSASLAEFEQELKAQGTDVITAVFDVRDYSAVEAFADKTFARFGAIDYLINNAGISSLGSIFKVPLEEWRTVFDINVMGIVHGIKAFVPRMIAQGKECYVINTASNAGMQCKGMMPVYFMSKHAAVSVSESLAIELQSIQSQVKAYVFCPGLVPTNLAANSSQIKGNNDPYYQSEECKALGVIERNALANGLSLEETMDGFFAGLEADDFYIRTHLNEEQDVRYRLDMVLNKCRPAPTGTIHNKLTSERTDEKA